MRYEVERKFKPKTPQLGRFMCRECGGSFEGYYTYNRLVICSEECRAIRYRRQRKAARDKYYKNKKSRPPRPRSCVMCDTSYTPGGTRSDSRFCSLKCCLRGNQIERAYNLSLNDYHSMVVSQGGRCKACRNPLKDATPFIDHDHVTGRVRGLVHSTCNSVLGFVNDDPKILENLAKYLRGE